LENKRLRTHHCAGGAEVKITLELWDDQSSLNEDIDTSMWIFKLDGKEFATLKKWYIQHYD